MRDELDDIPQEPEQFESGPAKLVAFCNWAISAIAKLVRSARTARLIAGRNITLTPGATGITIDTAPDYAVPYFVVRETRTQTDGNGAKVQQVGIKVGAGLMCDRSQTTPVDVTNLRTFIPISGLDPGQDGKAYVYLEVTCTPTVGGGTAQVVASTSTWSDYPIPFKFTSDPLDYAGSGAPPTQEKTYLMLAIYYGANARPDPPLRQLVSTHLMLNLMSYAGLPALAVHPGFGCYEP